MSAPKRYEPNSSTFVVMLCRDHGEYVLYSDYAALAAELERMRSEHEVGFSSVVLKKWAADHAALAAENERLRKAGDRLHDALVLMHKYGAELHPSIWAWDAAKEGGRK